MTKSLLGRTIVITRAVSQSSDFINALESYGAHVLSCPTIEIKEAESYELLDQAIEHLYGYDWLIFTSTNAVKFFLLRLSRLNKEVTELDEVRVCAIGAATAERLHDTHVHVDVIPAKATAEGVYSALSDFVGGTDKLRGLNILLPRAVVGRDQLPKDLEASGARVDIVHAYRTTIPEGLNRGRLSAMLAGNADCIAFTSPSSVINLALLFDTQDLSKVMGRIKVACIGEVTSAAAVEHGLKVDIQPAQFNVAELARAIADYYST